VLFSWLSQLIADKARHIVESHSGHGFALLRGLYDACEGSPKVLLLTLQTLQSLLDLKFVESSRTPLLEVASRLGVLVDKLEMRFMGETGKFFPKFFKAILLINTLPDRFGQIIQVLLTTTEEKDLTVQTVIDTVNTYCMSYPYKGSQPHHNPTSPGNKSQRDRPTHRNSRREKDGAKHGAGQANMASTTKRTSQKEKSAPTPSCTKCGGTDGHDSKSCWAGAVKCHNCGKEGHTAKVCKSKAPNSKHNISFGFGYHATENTALEEDPTVDPNLEDDPTDDPNMPALVEEALSPYLFVVSLEGAFLHYPIRDEVFLRSPSRTVPDTTDSIEAQGLSVVPCPLS